MNLKIPLRVGRILVVLALIVALLGSSIPVPARAAGFTPALYALDATNLLIGGARALGIGPGSDPLDFNNLISDAKAALFDGVSPLVNVWLDYVDGSFRSFVPLDFLSRFLIFCFQSRTLLAPVGVANNLPDVPFSVGGYTFTCALDSVSFVATTPNLSGYKLFICVPGYSGATNISGDLDVTYYGGVDVSGINYRVYHASADSIVGSYYSGYSLIPDTVRKVLSGEASFVGSVSTSADLTLDNVGSSLSDSVYSDWTAGAITQEGQPFVPVSIPSVSDSAAIFTQTQAQAQAGTIPEAVVDEIVAGAEVVPETGTIADVITAVRALGADIVAAVQAIPAAIADVFSPPAISDEYMISLSDFFPFCLPFDIYDLLSALAADPQAPVFEWTIAVPRWGISHDIEIDLSEWDDIARLFRTFELGAFVLGLALITRQKFLRS